MMRNHLCCSALVLLTVLGSGGTVAGQCRWGEECVCLQCPAGQQPTQACGQGAGPEGAGPEGEGPEEGVSCQSCPAGTFSNGTDAELCLPHSSCEVLRRKVATPGTPEADAVCGDCLPGFRLTPLGKLSGLVPCAKTAPPAPPSRVRSVRTVGGGPAGGGGVATNGTAVRSAEEKSAEYAVFALVPVFCVMGLLGILICNILKKKGYRCTADKDAQDQDDSTPQKEANGGAYIADDPNEDTISVLVRLITEKKENAAALEELLLEYESNQLALSKASSIKFPVLSNLSQFQSLPRLCPHHSHLHTISGLSGLAGRHGNHCSRCAQRKWPPILLAPGLLAPPGLKPRPPPSPGALEGPQVEKSPLLEGMCVDTHRTHAPPPATPPRGEGEGKRRPGEMTVGRFQVAQIQEQKPVASASPADLSTRRTRDSRNKSSLLDLFSPAPGSALFSSTPGSALFSPAPAFFSPAPSPAPTPGHAPASAPWDKQLICRKRGMLGNDATSLGMTSPVVNEHAGVPT